VGVWDHEPRGAGDGDGGRAEREEFLAGARRLARKVKRYQPEWVAVVGIVAYRAAFGRPKAVIGPQAERIGPARLWLLRSRVGSMRIIRCRS